MSVRRELISNALNARFRELCTSRISHLEPERFGEMNPFVSQVRELLSGVTLADLKQSSDAVGPAGWIKSEGDCLTSLRKLALGHSSPLQPSQQPPVDPFLKALTASRSAPERRFALLLDRYQCPLNFCHTGEDDAREHLLARLMAPDRAAIENGSVDTVESSDLLLRLNLVSLYAARGNDLRFLDALNYYYELLPEGWQPQGQFNWLLVSYFAFYARAIATRI